MKWESDQLEGFLGWNPPKRKGESEQPRCTRAWVDIAKALEDSQVGVVLDEWRFARMHDAPPFSGGVLDAWPALMVEGLAVCRQEEQAIDSYQRHLDRKE